jgi:predicted RNase H-like HicB family nuclease
MKRYAFVVFWSDEDAAWVADAPDLRSCSAYGSTPEEAMAELRIAVEAWLETARAHGLSLPEPGPSS